jgi:hypothetical protein
MNTNERAFAEFAESVKIAHPGKSVRREELQIGQRIRHHHLVIDGLTAVTMEIAGGPERTRRTLQNSACRTVFPCGKDIGPEDLAEFFAESAVKMPELKKASTEDFVVFGR